MSGWKEDDDGEGGLSGTVFDDVDLTEKEWADYDERLFALIYEEICIYYDRSAVL